MSKYLVAKIEVHCAEGDDEGAIRAFHGYVNALCEIVGQTLYEVRVSFEEVVPPVELRQFTVTVAYDPNKVNVRELEKAVENGFDQLDLQNVDWKDEVPKV